MSNQFNQLIIKIIFLGTPDFAVPSLKRLYGNSNFKIVGVITKPDKPAERGLKLQESAVKVEARNLKLPCFEPANKKELTEIVKELNADFAVVVAYGKIIPQETLDLLPNRILNLHPSLLPKYRGASPIQSAILNGDIETGTTIMLIDADLDHGPILAQEKLKIETDETAETLHDKLSKLGADLLERTLNDYFRGNVKPIPQDDSRATFCKQLEKEDGQIDWNKSAIEIDRQVRALNTWPGTYTTFKNQTIKILHTTVGANGSSPTPIGEFFLQNKKLTVNCGENSGIIIEQIQPAGKKIMSGEEFARGYLKM